MSRDFLFDTPYLEDFGAKTSSLVEGSPSGRENWTALNPSIGFSPEKGYAAVVRSSNYKINEYGIPDIVLSSIKNELWFSELDDDLNLTNLREIKVFGDIDLSQGVEDARLFWKNDSWYVLGVIQRVTASRRIQRLALFKLDANANSAFYEKTYESWDTARSEKNWMPVAYGENTNFDYIYSPNGIVKGSSFILSGSSDTYINNIRGGSCLWPLGDGTYLSITHSTYLKDKIFYNPETESYSKTQLRTYTHQFVHYDGYGKIIEISSEFVLEHLGIEFAAGLVEKDGNFVISYGVEDEAARLAVIPKEQVLRLLGPVGDDF